MAFLSCPIFRIFGSRYEILFCVALSPWKFSKTDNKRDYHRFVCEFVIRLYSPRNAWFYGSHLKSWETRREKAEKCQFSLLATALSQLVLSSTVLVVHKWQYRLFIYLKHVSLDGKLAQVNPLSPCLSPQRKAIKPSVWKGAEPDSKCHAENCDFYD